MGSYFRYHAGDEPVPGHRLLELLGKGGFGEVWRVKAPGDVKKALKIIDLTGPHGIKEFRSLDYVKNLGHPNLVTIQGCWLKDEDGKVLEDTLFEAENRQLQATQQFPLGGLSAIPSAPVELLIAMDLGDSSLYGVLMAWQKKGQAGIPVSELLDYMDATAKGIDFLNQSHPPIIHGDIKPHNLLLVGGSVKVCDYGMCKALQSAHRNTVSQVPVTVAYAPPELFDGRPSSSSDQYSLAITYVELRSGRLPFSDEDLSFPFHVMECHKRGRLDLSQLPPEVKRVIRQATALKSDDRWPTTRIMVRELMKSEGFDSGRSTDPPIIARPIEDRLAPPQRLVQTPRPGQAETMIPRDPAAQFTQGFGVTTAPGEQLTAPPDRLKRPTTAPPPVEPGRPIAPRIFAMLLALATFGGVGWGVYTLTRQSEPPDKAAIEQLIEQGKFDEALRKLTDRDAKISPNEKENLTKKCFAAWWQATMPQVKEGRFTAALQFIADHQSQLGEQGAVDMLAKIQDAWIDEARRRIRDSQLESTGAFISKPPPGIPDETRKSLHSQVVKRWQDEQILGAATAQAAFAALDKPPDWVSPSSGELGGFGKQVTATWTDKALDKFAHERFSESKAICDELLVRPELANQADLHVLRARLLLRLDPDKKNLPAVHADLAAAKPNLTPKLQLVHAALDVLAEPAPKDDAARKQMSTLVEKYHDTEHQLEKVADVWPLDDWESEEIRNIDKVAPRPRPPEDPEPALAKVDLLAQSGKFPEARAFLGTLDALPPATVRYYHLWLDLLDPHVDQARFQNNVVLMIGRVLPDTLHEAGLANRGVKLVDALEQQFVPANAEKFQFLDRVLEKIASAAKLSPDRRIAALQGNLAAKRIARDFTALRTEPSPQGWKQIDDDYQSVLKAGETASHDDLLDMFWLESQIAQGKFDPQDSRIKAAERRATEYKASGQNYRYARYVQALASREREPDPQDSQAWIDQIVSPLVTAFGGPVEVPALSLDFRRKRAATLLAEAAPIGFPLAAIGEHPENLLGPPFKDPNTAKAAYDALSLAEHLNKEVVSGQDSSKLFGLAAWHKPPPDKKRARELLNSVIFTPVTTAGADRYELLERNLGRNDTIRVLSTYFDLLSQKPVDEHDSRLARELSMRLAKLWEKSWPEKDDIAGVLYDRVLSRAAALTLADSPSSGGGLSPQHGFYANVAEFLEHYRYLKTPNFDSRFQQIENYLTKAIPKYTTIDSLSSNLSKDDRTQLASYLVRRGACRGNYERADLNLGGALRDADDALQLLKSQRIGQQTGQKLSADLGAALSLKGVVQWLRGRQESCYDQRRQARLDAIKLLTAVNDNSELRKFFTDEQRGEYLFEESAAHLELANESPKPAELAEHLHKAVDRAKEALKLNGRYPEETYTALGNAYEDLAWIAHEDMEENYQKAAQEFGRAIKSLELKPWAQPHYLLQHGRCLAKWLDYEFKKSNAEVANKDLDAAIQSCAPADQPEAHRWRAVLADIQGDYVMADKEFGKAVQSAEQAGDANTPFYRKLYATAPLDQYDRRKRSGATVSAASAGTLAAEARRRAAKLRDQAVAGSHWPCDLKLDAAVIEAKSDVIDGQPTKALSELANLEPAPTCHVDLAQHEDELGASEIDVLAYRLDLRHDSIIKKYDADAVDRQITDAKKLIASFSTSNFIKAKAYFNDAEARLSPQTLDALLSQGTAVLADYKSAVNLYPEESKEQWDNILSYVVIAALYVTAGDQHKQPVPDRDKIIATAKDFAAKAKIHFAAKPEAVNLDKAIERLNGL